MLKPQPAMCNHTHHAAWWKHLADLRQAAAGQHTKWIANRHSTAQVVAEKANASMTGHRWQVYSPAYLQDIFGYFTTCTLL